jgi:hypothetical protein
MTNPDFEAINQGMRYFGSLSPEQREELVSAFEKGQSTAHLYRLAAKVASETSQPRDKVHTFVNGMGQVFLWIESPEVSNVDAFIPYLARLACPPPADAEQITPLVKRLLLCERTIGVAAKAQAIMWGQGKVYQNARIITQIRPIFFRDPTSLPVKGVITHELAIEFRNGMETKTITLTMDNRQIDSLAAILQRAVSKESTLRVNPVPFQLLSFEED